MITKIEFAGIDTEIKIAIEATLNQIKEANQNDYALYLADGESRMEHDTPGFNPNAINDKIDVYKDSSRLRFLSEFLSSFYSFANEQSSTDDNNQRIHMELMVYTHIWEAQPFLKRLYRIAHQSVGQQYSWKVVVPEMSKHNFIINNVRQIFEDNNNHLSNIIKNAFHTSLRNAFAHSDYYFDIFEENRRIILDNYGGKDWELQEISYDDWSKRFVYSALLSYHLLNITSEHRKRIIETTGTDSFQIKMPSKTKGFIFIWIKYNKEHDLFEFE